MYTLENYSFIAVLQFWHSFSPQELKTFLFLWNVSFPPWQLNRRISKPLLKCVFICQSNLCIAQLAFYVFTSKSQKGNFLPDLHILNLFRSLINWTLTCERTLECLKTLFQPLCFARLVRFSYHTKIIFSEVYVSVFVYLHLSESSWAVCICSVLLLVYSFKIRIAQMFPRPRVQKDYSDDEKDILFWQ